jgi:lipoprotein-releasing system ATP-binding protein
MPENSRLSVENVVKEFPSADGVLRVLDGASLTANPGDAIAVTGPSGSGKSTLLYIVGLLEPPTSGNVRLDGDEPWTLDALGQARFRNRQVGFVFQDHHLLPQCTVLENVLIPTIASTSENSQSSSESRASQLLERVGLRERMHHRPAQLSGGERQRVAVCRALINQPKLLLADEPTGNLDRKTADIIGTLLLEVSREAGAILICVTHSGELAQRFERRYELVDGKLVDAGIVT